MLSHHFQSENFVMIPSKSVSYHHYPNQHRQIGHLVGKIYLLSRLHSQESDRDHEAYTIA